MNEQNFKQLSAYWNAIRANLQTTDIKVELEAILKSTEFINIWVQGPYPATISEEVRTQIFHVTMQSM